jgi:ferrous iron transport protein B
MQCHGSKETLVAPSKDGPIVLVGNPNVGKSVLFGLLTRRYVTVSNYPGTTVEVSRGVASVDGLREAVIDTPGVNSLLAPGECERVTRDILVHERPSVVVLVADAKNLARALVLAAQLAEMEVPFVLALNMSDEARERGIDIDTGLLSEILGVEVVSMVATRGEGLDDLAQALAVPQRLSRFSATYDEAIEQAVQQVVALLPAGTQAPRSVAVMLLTARKSAAPLKDVPEDVTERVAAIRRDLRARYRQPLGYVINHQRLDAVARIVASVYSRRHGTREPLASILGRLAIHPIAGVPIVLAVLYVVYKFVGEFGAGTLVNFLEGTVFGRYVNPWATDAVAWVPVGIVRDFFVGEYGLVTVALTYGFAIILPIVGTFFLVFSLLEDSGYLPRLAVMVNRPFKAMGLNGKAVLPMVLGLGCDTMATMTTRILDTRKERLQVTLLLALAIPCSAQLGVILGIIGGLGPAAVLIWAGVVTTTLFAVGYLASRVLPGRGSDFIQELPPLRLPRLSNVLLKTVARLEWYLKEVLPLFVAGTAFLFALDRVGALSRIERLASPLVEGLLGLPGQTTQTFLIGFLRRDYGAVGLFDMVRAGQLDALQALVSIVVITLFVPCIANFFVIVKEFGLRTALAVAGFIFPFAFLVGGVLNLTLRALDVGV